MSRVIEAMNPVLLSISAERAVADAARAMAERRVHHLLVMRGGELVGVVCTCDTRQADQKTQVGQIMARRVVSLRGDSTIDEAVALMLSERIGFLPVVENGAVIGVVTRGDLARTMGEKSERELMLACKWCGSHRHVTFRPMSGAPICDDCLVEEEDLGVGEGD